MTPEEEAHWRYTLEAMTNYGYNNGRVTNAFNKIPDEVLWLQELARYKCHLSNAYLRRQAAANGNSPLQLPIVFGE